MPTTTPGRRCHSCGAGGSTLIVSAEFDNIVPLDQQLLWSMLRQSTGHPVSVFPVDTCDAAGHATAGDGCAHSRAAVVSLDGGRPCELGLLFLMAHLDAAGGSP